MKRRLAISTVGAATLGAVLPIRAQGPRIYRLGVLSETVTRPNLALLRFLSVLGYEEGRNLVVDFKYSRGQADTLPALAAELLAAKPDVLIAPTNAETVVLKQATSTIPIVMLFASTPVELGIIASLARPGGNITGTTTNAPEMAGKMTQLLRDAVPRTSRVIWLADLEYPGMTLYRKANEQAALAMGLRLTTLPVRTHSDLDAALATVERDRPDVLGVATTGVISANIGRIVDFAARQRIPALYSTSGAVRNGGLMSYGPDFSDLARRGAETVDKIFKGAKPADIPVQEPAKFLFILNKGTAKALGLTVPPHVLALADEVLE